MPTYRDETERLRELHEDYAWQVNAAIGEGRDDLVRKLSDEYLLRAMQMMTGEHLAGGEGSAAASPAARPRAAGPWIFFRAPWRRRRR